MLAMAAQVRVEEGRKTDSYRLIVFNRAGTEVLLEARALRYELPLVNIPKFTRPAQEITTLLRNLWHIPSVLLFSGVLEQDPERVYFGVLEAQVRSCNLPEGMAWFPIHYGISHLLKDKKLNALESAYVRTTNRMAGDDPEPFSRFGWLSNLQDWVRTVIRPLGMDLKDFQQLNGCETFTLIRFDTTQEPVWFKAVGKPNLQEFSITLALAKLFPEYVPSILAPHPTYHGWLMKDAGQSSLDELEDSHIWKSVVTALAALQIASIGKTADLLETGCRDLCITKLLALVDPFLDVVADLMRQQTKVPPPTLTREELSDLSATLKEALHCLAALRIPDTLGHGDLNPANIVVGPERCAFIDWAEGHIGHPFLTFEYLLAQLKKDYAQVAPFDSDFRACYSRVWRSVASPEQIAESYLFSPLVAVYAYAAGSELWRDPERLKIPGSKGYLRSLTRRMRQEADLMQRRRLECL